MSANRTLKAIRDSIPVLPIFHFNAPTGQHSTILPTQTMEQSREQLKYTTTQLAKDSVRTTVGVPQHRKEIPITTRFEV